MSETRETAQSKKFSLDKHNFLRTIEFPSSFTTVSQSFFFLQCCFSFVLSPAYFEYPQHFTAFASFSRAGQVNSSGKQNRRNHNIFSLPNMFFGLFSLQVTAPTRDLLGNRTFSYKLRKEVIVLTHGKQKNLREDGAKSEHF